MIKITRGLDLPISGEPEQRIHKAMTVKSVALLGDDYPGIKPVMAVQEGDRIKTGGLLFTDRHTQINYTAPAAGIVRRINRGERRILQSIEIEIEGDEQEPFAEFPRQSLQQLSPAIITENLLASGLWTAFRVRPFGKNPLPTSSPHSIFVTAMDTNPLAADPCAIISEYEEDFLNGLVILARLGNAPVYVCTAPAANIPVPASDQIKVVEFAGPHPAGLPGTHIHFLDPVAADKTAWYLNYQDLIAIGKLFTSGHLWTERVISLAGPQIRQPRLLRTRLGVDIEALVKEELHSGASRIISGSVLSGREAAGVKRFLGRYHQQISVIKEGNGREFMGWLRPGMDCFSAKRIFLSHLLPKRLFAFSASQNGSRRAMVPIADFEAIMPIDILPVPLLKALLVHDTETAEALGCLELDEEDLALCSYICCSKQDYGAALRSTLNELEAAGK